MHYQRQFRKPGYQRQWRAKNADARRAYQRAWYRRNREKEILRQRERHIKQRFGLSLAEYKAILARGCAICGAKPAEARGLALDHDHATGVVRDALCRGCNTGLGSFADDPDRLRLAAEYLDLHRAPTQS